MRKCENEGMSFRTEVRYVHNGIEIYSDEILLTRAFNDLRVIDNRISILSMAVDLLKCSLVG